MDEDWDLLVKFLPADWEKIAAETNALKGLRKDKSPENFLRVLLMHVGCGHSLRETVVRAHKAKLAEMSDVALLKRLKKSKDWLYGLCTELFRERGVALGINGDFSVRIFDATNVKEPGKTGSLWRIHYSVQLPSLRCDFFKLTETEGPNTGESFKQFPIQSGDYVFGDRGYSHGCGIHYVASKKAFVTVRVNTASLPFEYRDGKKFDLLEKLKGLDKPGIVKHWQVAVRDGDLTVAGRICVIRKTDQAIEMAHKKLRRKASKKGLETKDSTFEYAKFVILFTTFPEKSFSAARILEWYRIRWQVELVFKRFKSIARFGHLPKYDDESAKAWLYGKLLVALLVEKLIGYADSVSPWGYLIHEWPNQKPMERIFIRP